MKSTMALFAVSLLMLATRPAFAEMEDWPGGSEETGFFASSAEDEKSLPLWEVGIGGGGVIGPAYPASSETTPFGLALPYFIYRGEKFRIGDGSVARWIALDSEKFTLDLSFDGSLPADSEDVDLRDGMPDLDLLFEVGPQLIYHAFETEGRDGRTAKIDLNLQTRAVFSTDFSNLDHQGYIIEPNLTYQQKGLFGKKTLINFTVGPMFASEDLQDYFYEVDQQFVRAGRPAFDAEAGYLGTELTLGISPQLTDTVRGFIGGSMNFHAGAANEDSPLFEEDITFGIGAGLIWRLYESDARAPKKD